jgi:hypothetical protein
MEAMRAYALALTLALTGFASACERQGDYTVAVSWLINGTAPSPEMCLEQGIAKARFEVSGYGDTPQSIEADCASTIELYDDELGYLEYGGFLTKRSFDWATDYSYTLTLLDAQGRPVSNPGSSSFWLDYGEDDFYELPYLDYFQPQGQAAAVHGEWSVGNGDLATECAKGRIARVELMVSSALDIDRVDREAIGDAPCAAGAFTSPGKVLANGYYHFWYEALSSDGSFISASAPTDPIEVRNQDLILPRLPL